MAKKIEGDAAESTARVVERNIEALLEHRKDRDEKLTRQERIAATISGFAGSVIFVWLHVLVYGTWVVVNAGLVPGVARFDPTFVFLATIASVEGIFLSTFILITQNRMQENADRRADLNLQVSLLAEHEITSLIKLVAEIGERMDIKAAQHPEIGELKKNVKPEKVLDVIEQREEEILSANAGR